MFSNRKAASIAGATTYFTGEACKHGHVSFRWTRSGTCSICSARMVAAHYRKNARKIKQRAKVAYAKNYKRVSAKHTQYTRERYRADPEYKTLCSLRGRLNRRISLKKAVKAKQMLDLIGCDKAQLVAHISSLFEPGMSWENYGQWHIDHIMPCAAFDLMDPAQQVECFHYTNLQPLWAIDNLRKNSRLPGGATAIRRRKE